MWTLITAGLQKAIPFACPEPSQGVFAEMPHFSNATTSFWVFIPFKPLCRGIRFSFAIIHLSFTYLTLLIFCQ